MNAECLLDMGGAAEFLSVSRRWVQDAVTRPDDMAGSIPHHLLPSPGTRKQRRFDPGELRDWLKAGSPTVADWKKMY